MVGALGLPFLTAVFLPGLYRYWRDTRVGSSNNEQMAAFEGVWDPSSMGCELAGDQLMIPGTDLGIPISSGRPDFAAVLQAAAKETGAKHVGVYVAGPDTLSNSAHSSVCQLNKVLGGGTYFDFHKMAGFL
ncbi:FRE1D [Auxenochlorella protothecoides x Auxenochlorella symbiontica]